MSVSPQDSQDVTLASADPDLLLCWERKVKQGKECSLLLEYRSGKVTTTLKVSKVRGSKPGLLSLILNLKMRKRTRKVVKKKERKKIIESS